MIRAKFWRLLRNESTMVGIETMQDSAHHHGSAGGNHGDLHHFKHCFDYLRQTMMCTLDMTIEFAAKDPETGEYVDHIDGWGIPHTCNSRVGARRGLQNATEWYADFSVLGGYIRLDAKGRSDCVATGLSIEKRSGLSCPQLSS